MYPPILVPPDRSSFGEYALLFAGGLARLSGPPPGACPCRG
jgi:hypothetical protein